MKKFLLVLGVFALVFSGVPTFAQENSGMTGVVTDVSGAVLPDTVVVISNPSTGVTFTQTTNSQGTYRFPNLPPQTGYVVTFTHSGFASVKVSDVELNVGVSRTQNASLVAGATASVEVDAHSTEVTLNTTDASIGNNFNIELLNDLPVQSRNTPAALFTLQPGVVNSSVAGARTDQTSFTVDGMDVNDISTGSFTTFVANLPVDAVQEFKGTVAGLPTSLGTGSGGQFQMVTKSGTNHFHGNVNEYHRDTSTTSNLWFNNNGGVGRTPLIQNQFGGAIGGPILHNKLFIFADFYNSRIIQSITTTRTVPLDSYRAGNISYIKNTAGCTTTPAPRQNTNPACIGTYTPAQVKNLDPAGIGENPNIFALINSRYPHVNDVTLGDGVNQGIYRFTQPAPNIEYDGIARMDYNLTKHQQVFIQFHAAHRDSIQSQNRFGGDPVTRPFQDRSYGFVGSHTWQIGSNKVNQFYYGDNIQIASFPLTYNPLGTSIFNTFGGATGSGGFTTPYDGGNIQRRRIPIPTVRDDFNWQLGRHTIAIGGTFKFIKTSNLLVNDYNFYDVGLGGGNTTSLNASLRPADINLGTTPLAEFDNTFVLALGRIGAINSNYNYTASGAVLSQNTGGVRRYRYYQTEVYVGDVWKVNKQLTVNYGLRYQYDSVPYESAGAEAIPSIGFDSYMATRVAQSAAAKNGNASLPFITYDLGGKANNGPNFYDPNVKDFAPRFAVVYNPASFEKLVINGGAGIVYDRTVVNAIQFIQNQASYLFQNSAATNYGDPSSPSNSLQNDPRYGANFGFPTAPVAPAIGRPYTPFVSAGVPNGLTTGQGNFAVDPHLHDPYSIQMNAGMQQELPGRFVMKLNYVGRLGRRLLGQADGSQLIDYVDPVSGQALSQAYAALTTQLRSGVKPANVTKQPWFENVLTPGFGATKTCAGVSCGSNTVYHATNSQSNIQLGNINGSLRTLATAGILPANTGLASQFSNNTYYTNKGFSTYNGMLVTLSRNLSQGVKFDFNYTWSHSIDNVSVVANTVSGATGSICDVLHMRACRGNSDFDSTHIIATDFVAQLPFGRGRMLASNVPWYLDEFIGGWSLSGNPRWQSGQAITTASSALIGGFSNNAPAIFNGNSGDIQAHVHKNSANQVQLFNDISKALADFSGPVGIQYGSRNVLRGPSQFNMDVGLAKNFQILPNERLKAVFRADFFNILNHPTFTTLSSNITSATFGTLSAQLNGARVGQFALRLEF